MVRKNLIYFLSILLLSCIFVVPNTSLLFADVAVLKENIQAPMPEDSETISEARVLPSFLESSTGVYVSNDIGLVGKHDPTVPLAFPTSLKQAGLDNDLAYLDIELTEEEKKALIESSEQNGKLEDIIVGNTVTNGSSNTANSKPNEGVEEVRIKVVPTLAEFIKQ